MLVTLHKLLIIREIRTHFLYGVALGRRPCKNVDKFENAERVSNFFLRLVYETEVVSAWPEDHVASAVDHLDAKETRARSTVLAVFGVGVKMSQVESVLVEVLHEVIEPVGRTLSGQIGHNIGSGKGEFCCRSLDFKNRIYSV